MQTNPFHVDSRGTVTTCLPDGSVARMPLGDFLDSQRRIAHELRQAAIDAAFDKLLRRLRQLVRRVNTRLRRRVQSLAAVPRSQP